MTRLTVDIDNRKSEKVLLAVIEAMGLNYEVQSGTVVTKVMQPLNKAEAALYKRLKKSFEEIKLHQEGKIELKTIDEVLTELS